MEGLSYTPADVDTPAAVAVAAAVGAEQEAHTPPNQTGPTFEAEVQLVPRWSGLVVEVAVFDSAKDSESLQVAYCLRYCS